MLLILHSNEDADKKYPEVSKTIKRDEAHQILVVSYIEQDSHDYMIVIQNHPSRQLHIQSSQQKH